MQNGFEISVLTGITFGWGAIRRVGELVRSFGRSALLVTGEHSARRAGHLALVRDVLEDSGVRVVTFERITPNPRAHVAEEGGQLVRQEHLAAVIGLGGGSALDAAKGIAVAAVSDV